MVIDVNLSEINADLFDFNSFRFSQDRFTQCKKGYSSI